MQELIHIAIAKGRVFDQAVDLLTRCGFAPRLDGNARKLYIPSVHPQVEFIIVRNIDVPTYVAHGGAHLGIVGKDILLEFDSPDLYELLDLKTGACRLVVAGCRQYKQTGRRLRVATKYVRTTQRHFAMKGRQVEIIKLYGSMELAPLVGLSDLIVDVTETGKTLKENNLVVVEEVLPVTTRLIANRAALRVQYKTIRPLLNQLQATLETGKHQ